MTFEHLVDAETEEAIGYEWPMWPPAADDEQRALLRKVLDSGKWGASNGEECERFAQKFAERHGAAHGVTVANGTIALFAALQALGVGPGDEVIVPSYTFVACATATILAGARPVLCDVSEVHLHMDAASIEPAITEATRVIMVVHLAGSPAPMDEINELARRHGVAVIEDAAQAHGAEYLGAPVGSLSDVGMFSFQSSKAMTAGEGGVLITNDSELSERIWTICNVGRTRGGAWYGHPELGWNLRMTELQAALLSPWLSRLEQEIATREQFAAKLGNELRESSLPVCVVDDPPGTTRNSRHLLLLRLEEGIDRERIVDALAEHGLSVDLGYPGLTTIESLRDLARSEPTPRLESVKDRLFWIRQGTMMSGEQGAKVAADLLQQVLP